MRQRAVIQWGISSFFGWGIYGLGLALNWSRDADIEPVCSVPIRSDAIAIDPLKRSTLDPFLRLSGDFERQLKSHAGRDTEAHAPVLAALNETFEIQPGAHGIRLTGQPTVGVVFFERAILLPEAVARAGALPLIVVGSTWNQAVLAEYGITRVKTVLQGIDPTLFHPAPASGLMGDRFCVFSGGKPEFRKGQDIVLAAFRIFARRHAEALLVVAWHNPWPAVSRTLELSPLLGPVPFTADGRLDVTAWAIESGVAAEQFLDLGAIANPLLPPILREMDVAVFPNRCEGGTNLVAMECMACGVPVVLSRNSGHLDLIEEDNCYPLETQGAIGGDGAGYGDVTGWGESNVDELVELLERIHADREEARRRGRRAAEMLSTLTWARTAEQMKQLILTRH